MHQQNVESMEEVTTVVSMRKALRSMEMERRRARRSASQERTNARHRPETRQTEDEKPASSTRGRPEYTRDVSEPVTSTPDRRSEIHVPERKREKTSSPLGRSSESRRKRKRISLAGIESKIRDVL